MSTPPIRQNAATPSKGAVSTPDKKPSAYVVTSTIKAYTLHKDLLCFYSDYFRAAFNGSFKEATERKLEVSDVEKHVFEEFQVWLYTRNLPEMKSDNLESYFSSLVEIWIFDQHQIPLLQNQVMDMIFDKWKTTKTFTPRIIPEIYAKTLAGSPLRKACIEIVAWSTQLEDKSGAFMTPGAEVCWTSESLIDLVLALNQSRLSKDVKFPVLPKRDKCFFHVHGKDGHC
ncbi:unnamed protein product [Aureobasidium uvarum]|uniref:BTB domain-containing protein n=1 Tax=Aureobasidium uvarum TaxID=2773716 RepID=A0A9N8KCG6_9PEZI|nr:unnamed protein product [Aureobasidium uvarum]